MADRFDSPKYIAAKEIVLALRAAGHQAYFAGGCVRDLLLGVEPKDFDVATSATPDLVMGMFAKTYSVGAHFGVPRAERIARAKAERHLEHALTRLRGGLTNERRARAARFV